METHRFENSSTSWIETKVDPLPLKRFHFDGFSIDRGVQIGYLMGLLKLDFGEDMIESLVNEIDTDGDGSISFEEFCTVAYDLFLCQISSS